MAGQEERDAEKIKWKRVASSSTLTTQNIPLLTEAKGSSLVITALLCDNLSDK